MTMDVYEAIHRRRSVKKFRPQPVPRALVEKILEAGTWAPNHRRNEPWFFHVVTGDARERLVRALAGTGPDAEERAGFLRVKLLSAPVLVAVSVADDALKKPVDDDENFAAAIAAIENILLAATAEGLGAILRTGKTVQDPALKAFLGLPAERRVAGIVYLGWPDEAPETSRRPLGERLRWLE
jgi:nitroreductase